MSNTVTETVSEIKRCAEQPECDHVDIKQPISNGIDEGKLVTTGTVWTTGSLHVWCVDPIPTPTPTLLDP